MNDNRHTALSWWEHLERKEKLRLLRFHYPGRHSLKGVEIEVIWNLETSNAENLLKPKHYLSKEGKKTYLIINNRYVAEIYDWSADNVAEQYKANEAELKAESEAVAQLLVSAPTLKEENKELQDSFQYKEMASIEAHFRYVFYKEAIELLNRINKK